MNDWLPVALRAPWWLLLLPLPWLTRGGPGRGALRYIAPRARGRKPAHAGDTAPGPRRRAAAFADPHLLRWLLIGPAPGAGPRLVRLAWLLIVIAASGPYLPQASDGVRRFGLDVAVVLDISPSMAADDIEPTRLKRAVLELRDLVRRLGDDRAALIVYSAYAYRILPLTHDLELLNHYAGALGPELTRRHGSNLAQALEYAAQALGEDRTRGRAVVILSDGETGEHAGALAAADRLKERGIPVFALGIGSEAGTPVPGANGFLRTADGIVVSRLDRALLAELARRSGGDYADARVDDRDWERFAAGLDSLRRSTVPPAEARTGYPLHPWLLSAGFALLLWSGVRGHAAAPLCLLLAAGTMAPQDGHAAPWQEQAAFDALMQGENDKAAARYQALDNYKGWLGRGAAYYRLQRWEQALAAFAAAADHAGDDSGRATALYNQGTTLARLGRYGEAEAALEQALRLQPNHGRTRLNLNLVQRAAAPPPPAPAEGMARQRAAAEHVASVPEATDRRADAGGDGAVSPSADSRAAAGASESPEAQLARSIGRLGALRDRPDEILRHRFRVQDGNHPRVTDNPSW